MLSPLPIIASFLFLSSTITSSPTGGPPTRARPPPRNEAKCGSVTRPPGQDTPNNVFTLQFWGPGKDGHPRSEIDVTPAGPDCLFDPLLANPPAGAAVQAFTLDLYMYFQQTGSQIKCHFHDTTGLGWIEPQIIISPPLTAYPGLETLTTFPTWVVIDQFWCEDVKTPVANA